MLDLAVVREVVNNAHAQFATEPGGELAHYIPYLARVPDHLAALAVVTADGDVVSAGDAEYRFAIESLSKVCTLALALEDHGPEVVHQKVGANPTGLPFNSVIAVGLHQGKPLSPLVNAGAMAAVSLVKASSPDERWARILDIQRELAGAPIELSDEVNHSEQTTNYHNRGLANLRYAAGTLYCDPMEACEIYTRQCSTLIDTVELATIGATLAARGINPISGKKVLSRENIVFILAEMTMEGMYGASGDWAYTVGIPGKSGVGGGIVAVVPGVMGIAGFSPPLDTMGNSVRGQKMVASVARRLGYNLFSG